MEKKKKKKKKWPGAAALLKAINSDTGTYLNGLSLPMVMFVLSVLFFKKHVIFFVQGKPLSGVVLPR